MRVLILLAGMALGMYFIIADRLKIPYLKTSKAIMNMTRDDRKLTSNIEAIKLDISIRIAKLIPMDKYKRNRLARTLDAAGIRMTPECYTASAIVEALEIGLLAIPCLFIFPILTVLVLVLAVLVYFKEYQKADKQLMARREEIETELLRLADTLVQELRSSRDVLSILESFKKNTTPAFARELGITCADMRTGGYEVALMRMEARINSPQLSDVVRGLISVIRGDDGVMYFEMLVHDFRQAELRRLKSIAQKIPGKIKVLSIVMLMCFLATYFVTIAVEVIRSVGILF